MDRFPTVHRVACVFALACGVSQVVFAGDLNPPPGPIQATDRFILNQATTPGPHVIGVSGSYKLTSDISSGGGPGFVIQVVAADVTIDLNGFTIDGGGVTANGIQVLNRDVTIRNGHVRNCAGEGVYSASDGTVVEEVAVRDSFEGISVANGGRVAECTVRDVLGDGIDVTFSCTVEDCTVVRSGLGGFGWGIVAREGSAVVGSTVRDSRNGIQSFGSGTVDRCSVSSVNDDGFVGDGGAVFRGCSARFCPTAGFQLNQSTAIECSAYQNFGNGFQVNSNSVVDRCVANDNGGPGILVNGDRNTITGNSCARNQGFGGIVVFGNNGRFSNNTVTESLNDNFGVFGANNTIFANSATAAGSGINYNVIGVNDVATISTAAAAAVGNENISN